MSCLENVEKASELQQPVTKTAECIGENVDSSLEKRQKLVCDESTTCQTTPDKCTSQLALPSPKFLESVRDTDRKKKHTHEEFEQSASNDPNTRPVKCLRTNTDGPAPPTPLQPSLHPMQDVTIRSILKNKRTCDGFEGSNIQEPGTTAAERRGRGTNPPAPMKCVHILEPSRRRGEELQKK